MESPIAATRASRLLFACYAIDHDLVTFPEKHDLIRPEPSRPIHPQEFFRSKHMENQ